MKEQLTPEQSALYVKWQEALSHLLSINEQYSEASAIANELEKRAWASRDHETKAKAFFISSLEESMGKLQNHDKQS